MATDCAEALGFIGAHAAVERRSVYPFGHVTAALKGPNGILVHGADRGGHGRRRLQHLLPLLVEIDQSGQIRLPGLYLQIDELIVGHIGSVVLLTQAPQSVSQFVNHYATGIAVSAANYRKVIVDSASAVFVTVYQNNNVVVRQLGSVIISQPSLLRLQITINAQGVEAAAHGGGRPVPGSGVVGSALTGRNGKRPNANVRLLTAVRLQLQQLLA